MLAQEYKEKMADLAKRVEEQSKKNAEEIVEAVHIGKGGIQQFIVTTSKERLEQGTPTVWNPAAQEQFAFEITFHLYKRTAPNFESEFEEFCTLQYAHPLQQKFTH